MARNMKCPTTGKDIFWTAKAAEKTILYYSSHQGVKLHAYQCPACRNWHLTKKRQRRNRDRAEMFAGIPGLKEPS